MLVSSSRGDSSSGLKKLSQEKLVSLYTQPPEEEITLDEFELYALDRLQLLRGIENIKSRGFDGAEYTTKLNMLESKYMPLRTRDQIEIDGTGRTSDQRKDNISHFILRLAYCRTEELRRWFLAQECHLLKHRLDKLTEIEKASFMQSNGLSYDQLSRAEMDARREKLIGLAGVTDMNFLSSAVFRVPFQQALSLVGSRGAYLEGGFAFVPLARLVSTVVTRFRMNLSRSLVEAAQLFDHVSGDTRIGPLLKNMNKQYVGKDFSAKNGMGGADKLTHDKVDEAAEVHMPLCMKNLHNALTREHKLKHWGRLQYGLFLKGAGMDMEDALVFWETRFARLIQHDQFNKQYAYSIRHMYGKEGARKNYTPYSCMKIIMGTPPEPGAHHGCPYRHMPESQLASLLGSMKLGGPETSEIVRLAKTSNYQLACQKHFDVTHPGHLQMDLKTGGEDGATSGGGVANHPNLWYQTSRSYHAAKTGGKSAGSTAASVKVEKTVATDDGDDMS